MDVAAGGGALSIVWHWDAHERRASRMALLAARVLALRARTQPGDAKDGNADAAADQQATPRSQASHPMGPSGGENASFDAFFAQYERPLYGYLRRMLPTHDAALDVAQETFFRAWQHFDTISGYDRPQAWLFRVATNLALDALRRRQPIGLARLFGGGDETFADQTDANDAIPALMDPFDMEQSLAQRDLVNQALQRLPERQRMAVLLWAAHGLTTTEIADIFDTTEVNVRQLLSRGRARFRDVYEQMQKTTG
jgi:RNA polymerase sigma factor (sigma-70 family)